MSLRDLVLILNSNVPREYLPTRFGPVLAGIGTGLCLGCGRTISHNKEKCAACAANDSGVRVHPDILRNLPVLAPGVRGYTIEAHGALYIPVIMADVPGRGDVGRYLDSLKDRVVRVPTVTSDVLEGMLRRRGFVLIEETAPNGESVEVWERKPCDIRS